MEKQWNSFVRNYSLEARDILGEKTPLHIIRSKMLSYNTLLLGKQGFRNNLIGMPHSFTIFISELRSELTILEEHISPLRKLWIELEKEKKLERCVKRGNGIKALENRYQYFGIYQNKNVGQSMCLTASFIYDWLCESIFFDSETNLEAFAGYFNRRLKNWCSLFEDLEIPLGSQGSFFRLGAKLKNFDLIISNPPYQNPTLEATSKLLVDHQGSSISIIPDWRSKTEDISKDFVAKGSPIHPSRRWSEPYPAYEILRSSEKFQGVLFFQRMEFSNDFTQTTRTPEVSIIVVVLGDQKIFESLVECFVPKTE